MSKKKVSHFKKFGSLAYALVLDQHQLKLDGKGIKCIFVVHSSKIKGYRLYNPKTRKIIIRKDVAFNENKCFMPEDLHMPIGDDIPLDIVHFDSEEMPLHVSAIPSFSSNASREM